MAIDCIVSTDDGVDSRQMRLIVVPRVGESISLERDGSNKQYRVRQITHSDVTDNSAPSVAIEATSQLL